MADLLIFEFESPEGASLYNQVNAKLGLSDAANWPDGLLSHVAGDNGGRLVVAEMWESRAAQEAFMHARLGPALAEVQVPEPARVDWFSGAGMYHAHVH
jgi:hypothetical protein